MSDDIVLNATLQLPPHLEKLGGCLTGLSDPNDEKLNCLLSPTSRC